MTPNTHTGLEKLYIEMAKQHGDSATSFAEATDMVQEIISNIVKTKRLVLLGMGASHWANRIVEPLYRAAGVDATAVVVSEYLRAPFPIEAGQESPTMLFVSQSGGSGEIIKCIDDAPSKDNFFGMTLNSDSPLGQRLPCLLGAGGTEEAFAATRSILITIALHGAILNALGMPQDDLFDMFADANTYDDAAAVGALTEASCVVFSSRGPWQGVAEAGSLCFMELARIPTFPLEGGQFRHGPFEILREGIGVVLVVPFGNDADTVRRLAEECVQAGVTPIVYDLSGKEDVAGTITVKLAPRDGLAGTAEALVALQSSLVKAAAILVPEVGTPLRSSKVTDGE